ncbi:tRNA pseudouridine synthase B [Linum perenne]
MATLSNPPIIFPTSLNCSSFSILPTRHSLFSLSQTRFSSKTPYPLQYDMIISRPTQSSVALPRRHRPPTRSSEESLVELKPEVVEFHRLHKREEELYFYDALAYPWEKDKHYKMVYQLEKKYFPDQCLDKAFLDPKDSNLTNQPKRNAVKSRVKIDDDVEGDKKLLFFEDGDDKKASVENVNEEVVTHKKVADFFKVLKKGPPGKVVEVGNGVEPFLATRTNGLPPTWDAPYGTVVLVNKPKGWTSFTVCGKLRRLVKVKKVGHAGTLDPMATGLLIVCVGKATKVVDSYQGMVKGYSGVFRLGEATSTWDADSPVIQREPWEQIKDNDIKKAAASFLGEIWQVPPMFSAIKVGGEKMYDKARRGESVELAPRRISIFQFDIERSLEDRQNLIFRVTCSKGTYIRSLCADLGKALGSCAHLTALRRDSIGEYLADDAWEFKELEDAIAKSYF